MGMKIPPEKQLNCWLFTEAMLLDGTKGLLYQNKTLNDNETEVQR